MSAEPLRHYYAAHDAANPDHDHARFPPGRCARRGCALPESDPVHLTPGDDQAFHDAIRAASPHPEPQRTPEEDEAARARAAQRTAKRAGRYTFGTLRDRPRAPREAG